MTRIAVLTLAIVLLAGNLLAGEPKSKEVLKRIDFLLNVYAKDHPLKQYPSTLKEFQQFAAKKGKPLDLSAFSTFKFERHGTSLDITYTCKDTGETASIVASVITTD